MTRFVVALTPFWIYPFPFGWVKWAISIFPRISGRGLTLRHRITVVEVANQLRYGKHRATENTDAMTMHSMVKTVCLRKFKDI